MAKGQHSLDQRLVGREQVPEVSKGCGCAQNPRWDNSSEASVQVQRLGWLGWGGQEEGNKERLWLRGRMSEEAPMAVGPGWEGPVDRLALLKESRMDRITLWELREKGQSRKASWKRGALEHECACKEQKVVRWPEKTHCPWVYREGQYTEHLLWPWAGRLGSNAVPALRQRTGWRERQV